MEREPLINYVAVLTQHCLLNDYLLIHYVSTFMFQLCFININIRNKINKLSYRLTHENYIFNQNSQQMHLCELA